MHFCSQRVCNLGNCSKAMSKKTISIQGSKCCDGEKQRIQQTREGRPGLAIGKPSKEAVTMLRREASIPGRRDGRCKGPEADEELRGGAWFGQSV